MKKDRTPEEYEAFFDQMYKRNDMIKRELEEFKFYIAMENKAEAAKRRVICNELVDSFERDFKEFMGVSVNAFIGFPEES